MKLFPLIVLAFMLAGCGGRHDIGATLDRADRLLFVSPDSALALLDSVDSPTLSEADRARRAFLVTKARHFGDYPLTDDSLINIAVDYYAGRGDSVETQSYFLKSLINSVAGDIDASLLSAMMAYDCASRLNDYPYMGRAARQLAETYPEFYSFAKSIEQSGVAIDCFRKAGMNEHADWELLSKAWNYSWSYEAEKAMAILDSVKDNPRIRDNAYYGDKYYLTLAKVKAKQQECAASNSIFKYYLQRTSRPESYIWGDMAINYISLNMPDSASFYNNKAAEIAADQRDSIRVAYVGFMIKENEGDFKGALADLKTYIDVSDRNTDRLLITPYTYNISDYFHNAAYENQLKARDRQLKLWTSILIAAVLIAVVLLLYISLQIKNRKNRLEYSELKFQFGQIKERLCSIENDSTQTSSDLRDKFSNYVITFDQLCRSMKDKKLKDMKKRDRESLNRLISPEELAKFDEIVDILHDKLMSDFKRDFPEMNREQYTYACLLFAGLSNESISFVTGRSVNALYTNKARMKNKIIEKSPERLNDYLQFWA